MKIKIKYTFWRRLLSKLVNIEVSSKNILNTTLISLTLILFNIGNLQTAIAHEPSRPVYTDYFDHITLFSQGRITRFTQMPIRVYISPILKESQYLPEIRYAMQEWHTASNGDIRFEETETPQNVDIRVSWGHSGLHTDFQDMRLGSAELTRRNTQAKTLKDTKQMVVQDPAATDASPPFTVEVILMLEGDGTIGELSQKEMRTVCLHEFGHAIGLWGHSPHPGDIIYPTATVQHPSTRDIATLRKLYNTPLNTPQHDIAIQVLKSEIVAKPYAEKKKQLRSHYLLGTIHFDKGDTASAIASFLTCRQLDAKFKPAIEKLIQAYHETGKTHDAIALLEKRLTYNPSPADYNTLGIFYYEKKEAEKAIHAFEKALHIAPYHKAARRNLHQLLRAKGFKALATKDFETATTTFERVIRMDPLDAPTYQLMGNGYAQVGQFETAINYYQKAIDINPVDVLTKHHLAECYKQLRCRPAKSWRMGCGN